MSAKFLAASCAAVSNFLTSSVVNPNFLAAHSNPSATLPITFAIPSNTGIPTLEINANSGAITLDNASVTFFIASCPSVVLPNASFIAKNAATIKPIIPNETVILLPNVAIESCADFNPPPNLPIGPGNDANWSPNCFDLKFTLSCASCKSSNLFFKLSNSLVLVLPWSSNFCNSTVVSLI